MSSDDPFELMVVLDLGSRWTRCGFSGEPEPRCVFRTPTLPEPRCVSRASTLTSQRAGEEGWPILLAPKVADWRTALRPHLSAVYFRHLLCNPREHAVLVVEGAFWSYAQKRAVYDELFTLGAPRVAMLLAPTLPPLSACASALGAALVVDMGHAASRAVCVIDHTPLLRTLRVTTRAGRAAAAELGRALALERSLPAEVLEDLVATYGVAAAAPGEELRAVERQIYVAAEGSSRSRRRVTVRMDAAARLATCECLFGDDFEGPTVPETLCRALLACPRSARPAAASRIIFAGAMADIPGMRSRVLAETARLAESNPEFAQLRPLAKRLAQAPAGPLARCPTSTRAWVGASLLGKMKPLRSGASPAFVAAPFQRQCDVPDWSRPRGVTHVPPPDKTPQARPKSEEKTPPGDVKAPPKPIDNM